MQMRTSFFVLPLLLILFVPPGAAASEPFQDGLRAFEKGNYEQALDSFRQAEALGKQTPQLHYNIGVCWYKTGGYQKAAERFRRLLQYPDWNPLALYNLGLVAEAAGRPERAADYYLRARDASDPFTRIRRLAVYKIKELRSAKPGVDTGQWYGLVSAAAGYDDNAVLAPDDTIAQVGTESDFFADLFGFAGRYMSGDYTDGVRFEAGAYGRLYTDETEFNSAALFAGLSRDKHYAKWHFQGTVDVDADFVEGDHYATTPAIEIALTREFESMTLGLKNSLSWIEAQTPYGYLTGVRNRLTVDLTYWITDGRVVMGYGFEYNNREDLAAGSEFFSYSPLRNKVFVKLDWRLTKLWRMEFRGEYRNSRYPDPNRELNPDGSVSYGKREDDRIFASIRGGYMLTQSLALFAEYSRTDNDANFPRYDYVSNQFMLGAEKSF